MVQIDLEKIEARSQSKKKIPTCVGIMTNEAVLKSKLWLLSLVINQSGD